MTGTSQAASISLNALESIAQQALGAREVAPGLSLGDA